LGTQATHSFLARRAKNEAREAAPRPRRNITKLPPHLQREFEEVEETLRHKAQFVEVYKPTAHTTAKRKALVYKKAALLEDELRLLTDANSWQ
jgi:hypothetical protein